MTSRDSTRYPLVIAALLGAAALMVGALAFQTWRSARTHREAAERVLRDYASFASWTFGSRVRTQIFVGLNPVFGGADRQRSAEGALAGMHAAADSISRCSCGVDLGPRFFFFIDLRTGYRILDTRATPLAQSLISARIEDIARRASAELRKGVASREPGALPYRMLAATSDGQSWVAFYAVRFRDATDPGSLIGFDAEPATFARSVFDATFRAAPLLPRSLTKDTPNDSLLSIAVTNSSAKRIYVTSQQYRSSLSASLPVSGADSALSVSATINPGAVNNLIIGGVPESPLRPVLPLVIGLIAVLSLAFVLMWKREVSAVEIRASLSEARLASLRGQLQPHFLFNVLNTIAMLARKGETQHVVAMLSGLSDLLRRVLAESPTNEVPLTEELDFVKQYLTLEQVRYGDRLEFEIDAGENVRGALVPGLILQPIVENAIRHGISQKREGGRVEVTATQHNGKLALTVVDSGSGLSDSGEESKGTGAGLRITRERLQHMYGDQASIVVERGNGAKTSVQITIPMRPSVK